MMTKPTLYLFMGYPGAGKTTVAKMIEEATGAVHLWADKERRAMFGRPTHAHGESKQLYGHLNQLTGKLLAEGKSVIFDTNFNFFDDREHLRQIANNHDAKTVVVWITTPKAIAKQRAVHDRVLRNGYEFTLPAREFERMANNLQSPRDSEQAIRIDATDTDAATVKEQLGL